MRSNFAEAQSEAIPYDFRKTTWGMSRSEVKLAESRYLLSENKTHITYTDQFMKLEATIGYHFINDSLVEAGYAFREVCLDLESYILKYEEVKLKLSQSYGFPIIDREVGISCEKDSCCMQPRANVDSKMFIAEWKTARSIIRLLLVSDKVSTEFGVLHISREQAINLSTSVN
ncbi:MAG: hypothetical protein WBC96_02890 [Thermodesulfobacteriota bacterium]